MSDWKLSKHFLNDIDFSVCHGDKHHSADDVANAKLPTAETCNECHDNPDYELWYGWSEMKMDLTEINELAEQMRMNKH